MSYESWRISYQSDEQAARAAYYDERRRVEQLAEALEDLVSLAEEAMREVGEYDIEAELGDARAAIAKAT